jgi:hypothetical protein
MSQSKLSIGPIDFTYQVQEISLQEIKSVEALQAARTDRNFISETGQGNHRAVIRLLITGLDEINGNLRRLIALFKCCPIVSVYNELISKSWDPALASTGEDPSVAIPAARDASKKTDTKAKKKVYSKYIPVALEDLSISSVPDLPFSFYVTLTISRIDISSIYSDNILLYSTELGPSEIPNQNTFLNRWIDAIVKDNKIPYLDSNDFLSTTISWNGEYATGERIPSPIDDLSYMTFGPNSHTKVQSEQCSIKNLFAYNVMQAKGYPFAQHMGSTAMFYSMDIMFTNQLDDNEFKAFCAFKESSDYIARSKDRLSRVAGWEISSPIVKMLSARTSDKGRVQLRPRSGVFVPLHVNIDTANLPPLNKAVRIDLAETNFEVFSNTETLLVQGGSDYDGLKAYFDSIVANDYEFRSIIKINPVKLAKAITGQDSSIQGTKLFDDHSTFWPIVNGYFKFSTNETFGLLNRDTLLATFLDLKFDEQEKLRMALQENITLSGRAVSGNRVPSFFTRVDINYSQLQNAFFGASPEEKAYKNVFDIIYDYTKNYMFEADGRIAPREEKKLIDDIAFIVARKVFIGFFGDYTSVLDFTNESGSAVQNLSDCRLKFSKKFTDSLFNVIAKRSGPPENLPRVFNVDGLMAAFLKLSIKYTGDAASNPDLDRNPNKDVNTAINKFFRRSVYEDLLLPKYIELYGNQWKNYAPTYSDVGIINPMPGNSTTASNDAQEYITVEENDTVSPHAWFYNKKYKPELLDQVTDNAKDVSKIGHTFHLSVPFSTEDINAIEREFEKVTEERKSNPNYKSKTLSQLIRSAFVKARIYDEEAYEQSMNQLAIAASERYAKKYMASDARMALYVHHNDNFMSRKRLSTPGLAKELYTVASDYKLLRPSSRLPHLDTDAGMRSGDRANEFEFIRSLDDNTRNIIESDLNQTPDIYESAAKMFPAAKVYLLEKRGTDLYGDDSFFSVNPIISIDITMDKDDADLAVIRIADPLFVLQRDFFPASNLVTVNGESGQTAVKQVLGSLKGNNLGGYLKRYKIIEGRPIQIRMGYESMPFNLKTVFTGKIVEIQPGDVLTIVCQGWKAELINRQVNFANPNIKNWGVRDLVIQALQQASPDGYGDFYPQLTTDFILKNMKTEDVQEFLSNILQRQEGIDTINGSRTVGAEVTNYVAESLSMESRAEQNKGLDTRLKNVWWPDLASPNNFLGWRSFSGIMPSQVNDGWICPLQPCWDVLKEGTRHAWNSIVQVVPFDGEATVFFGHPDQPYYFTKGGPNSRQKWRKYINQKRKNERDLSELKSLFLNSEEYNYSISSFVPLTYRFGNKIDQIFIDNDIKQYPERLANLMPTDLELFTDLQKVLDKLKQIQDKLPEGLIRNAVILGEISSVKSGVSSYKALTHVVANSNFILRIIDSSFLPRQALDSIRDKLGHRTVPILCSIFWNIPEDQIQIKWPTAESDVPSIAKSSSEISEQELTVISSNLFSSLYASDIDFLKELRKKMGIEYSGATSYRFMFFRKGDNYYFAPRFAGKVEPPRSAFPLFETKADVRPVSTIIDEYYFSKASLLSDYAKNAYKEIKDKVVGIEQLISVVGIPTSNSESTSNFYKVSPDDAEKIVRLRDEMFDLLRAKIKEGREPGLDSPFDIGIISSADDVIKNLLKFKIFVYFFDKFLSNSSDASALVDNNIASDQSSLLPPNMQVFRQHHWVDTDHDIIKNNIVASTKDMWNTVVIEYPAHGEAESKLDSAEDLYTQGDFYSGLKWIYYPKNEVSGVVGLQFHPGLTLASKKVRIFTELNCNSDELACKLACTHLADGIRRMYRGTLLLTGRVIKPHDRIILNDEYNQMTGPLEVESVVHHWSVDTGWVSNIAPQAVCDANPGAAVLQTAALEDTFNKVFKLVDYALDGLYYASIIATILTAGGAAPAAIGVGTLRGALAAGVKGLLGKGRLKFLGNVVKGNIQSAVKGGKAAIALKGSPKAIIKELYKNFGGLGKSVFSTYLGLQTTKQITNAAFRLTVTSSFVENAQKTEQLPVILAPLYFNGLPFLAGMETDDPIWSVMFNDVFWSLRDLNRSGEQLLQSLGVESYSDIEQELKTK